MAVVLIAPSANRSGARTRRAPFQIVPSQLNISSPMGIVRATAAAIAKYVQPAGIGAVYMFCIQASDPSTPTATIEPATARWLKIGLPENVGRISEIAPNAN